MSVDNVRNYLKKYGKDNDIQEFDVSSATVELAAAALNVDGSRIVKTLAFKEGDGCILICAAGDVKIDNKKFKAEFGFKAKMLSHEETFALTGHSVGGVCPFALPEGVKVYCDTSLKRFDEVYPACGSSNSAVKLTVDELYNISGSVKFIDVCKE